jgi:chromosome partitioning protein
MGDETLRTITLVNSKGGAGKSTLCAALGVAAEAAGERVFLIDMDPQASLLAWGERRRGRGEKPPPVDRIAPDRLRPAIAGLAANGYTLAVIDTPGIDTPATAEAMIAADLNLIPARASTLDLEAMRPTLTALARLNRPYAFVLNACPAGKSGRIADATRALSLLGVLAPVMVQRMEHVDALGLGLGVTEMDGKAGDEARALWTWIKGRMDTNETVAAVA